MNYMRQRTRQSPKTVRGAKKKGWNVVTLSPDALEKHNTSWLNLECWSIRQTKGNFVTCYATRKFAFEKIEDASWFTLKWCL
jgi:hypothetical protein